MAGDSGGEVAEHLGSTEAGWLRSAYRYSKFIRSGPARSQHPKLLGVSSDLWLYYSAVDALMALLSLQLELISLCERVPRTCSLSTQNLVSTCV